MGKTVLVDLSHPFGRGNPLWPSNGDFHIDRVQHMPMHYRLLQTFNDFHMHNSTHADSPSHVIPESPYTHELLWPCGLPGYPQKALGADHR